MGVIVNDIPQVIDKDPPQCISFPTQDVHLPLLMKGPVPVLSVSKPNAEDLIVLPRLQLTSDDQPWDLILSLEMKLMNPNHFMMMMMVMMNVLSRD